MFFIFNTNPRFPPFLLYVRCKSGVTFIRRSFRDDTAPSRRTGDRTLGCIVSPGTDQSECFLDMQLLLDIADLWMGLCMKRRFRCHCVPGIHTKVRLGLGLAWSCNYESDCLIPVENTCAQRFPGMQ